MDIGKSEEIQKLNISHHDEIFIQEADYSMKNRIKDTLERLRILRSKNLELILKLSIWDP